MLVFENDITDAMLSDALRVEPRRGGAMPLHELMAAVKPQLPDSAQVVGVQIFPDPKEAYRFNLSGRGRRALLVDQYTGRVRGMRERNGFFKAMHSLHGSLLDKHHYAEGATHWGRLFVGISTLLFLPALLSGVVLWWPRTRKALAGALRVTSRFGTRRLWLSMHDALGMYALLFLLAMSVTGLTWSFDWFKDGFYTMIGATAPADGGTKANHAGKASAADEATPDYAAWHVACVNVAAENPGHAITVQPGKVNVALSNYGNARAVDTYRFDEATGAVTGVDRYADSPRYKKAPGWIGAIHTGTWGGFYSKLLYFIAALIGFSLPLTGYWLWIQRHRHHS